MAMNGLMTPGPWRWGDWSATFGTCERPDRMVVLERNLTAKDSQAPCIRNRNDCAYMVMRLEEPIENDEDRRLIAAVPELVSALHELLDMFGGNMDMEDYRRLRELAGIGSR